MKSLFYSWDMNIDAAYIITLKGNSVSERLSKRCVESCKSVDMPYKIWEAFNGTGDEILVPEHLMYNSFIKMIKLNSHYCTKTEIAVILSHVSLWQHCVEIDKPIVILEHDAIMVKKYTHHDSINTIMYLGAKEWLDKTIPMVPNIPIVGSDGPNHKFLCRCHAYAIDPFIAKQMCSNILKSGIGIETLDLAIRCDLYNISHRGLIAYNEDDETTITNRPENGRTTKRNDDLKW